MRVVFFFALILTGCASTGALRSTECSRPESFDRGKRAAMLGETSDTSFIYLCPSALSEDLQAAYKEGQESVRAREPVKRAPARVTANRRKTPLWVCEVEASQKVFTGVGPDLAEATEAAKTSCSSHFRASYCRKAECKQSL